MLPCARNFSHHVTQLREEFYKNLRRYDVAMCNKNYRAAAEALKIAFSSLLALSTWMVSNEQSQGDRYIITGAMVGQTIVFELLRKLMHKVGKHGEHWSNYAVQALTGSISNAMVVLGFFAGRDILLELDTSNSEQMATTATFFALAIAAGNDYLIRKLVGPIIKRLRYYSRRYRWCGSSSLATSGQLIASYDNTGYGAFDDESTGNHTSDNTSLHGESLSLLAKQDLGDFESHKSRFEKVVAAGNWETVYLFALLFLFMFEQYNPDGKLVGRVNGYLSGYAMWAISQVFAGIANLLCFLLTKPEQPNM
jgi:hypothetical protein